MTAKLRLPALKCTLLSASYYGLYNLYYFAISMCHLTEKRQKHTPYSVC